MGDKPTIRIKQWHISGVHVYGKNIDDNNKHVRSTRIRKLESKDFDDTLLRDGDVLESYTTSYKLIGLRRRKFSDD